MSSEPRPRPKAETTGNKKSTPSPDSSAVVLLSGGLDSATTLAVASRKHKKIYALSFRYGQRHSKEVEAAKRLAKRFNAGHQVLDIRLPWKGSVLLDKKSKLPKRRSVRGIGKDVPPTYVPARNALFLSYALSWAETLCAGTVYIGANAVDYSGYPDCRPGFLRTIEQAYALGTKCGAEGRRIRIKAPLLKKTKAEVIRLGKKNKVPYELTWSCYQGARRPCGNCDSCLLRAKGFREAGMRDPLLEGRR